MSLNFVAVIHYFLSPLLVAHGFIPVLLSNLLFMVAVSYYHYLNFLGYDGKLTQSHTALLSFQMKTWVCMVGFRVTIMSSGLNNLMRWVPPEPNSKNSEIIPVD